MNQVRVLSVVDDIAGQETLKSLTSQSVEQRFVFDYEDSYDVAKERLLKREFEIALVDQQLNKGRGIELIRELRKEGFEQSLILLTSFGGRDIEKAALKAGATDYIVKNQLNFYYLEKSLKYAVEKSRSLFADSTDVSQVQLDHVLKMSSLGEIATHIIHEINNPMAVISTVIQLLKHRLSHEEINQANLSEAYDRIDRMSQRINKIIKSLKGFSRNGDNDPIEELVLEDLIEESLDLCMNKIRANEVRISCDYTTEKKKLNGRFSDLSQVLVNLVNNSIDAIAGQVAPWIHIEVSEQEESILFAVTDSGRGIREDLRDKILNPYFTTKGKEQGTGLGLSISKMIAERYKGDLFVNHECENTQFVLKIPFGHDCSKTVLIVDNEEDLLELAGVAFQQAGYQTYLAKTAEEALEIYKKESVNLVVTDIKMPGQDGIELSEQLYQLSIQKGEPQKPRVVFITACDVNEIPVHVVEEMGAEVLSKPFAMENLLEHCRLALPKKVQFKSDEISEDHPSLAN